MATKQEPMWNVLGEQVTCKATADDTGGAYSLFEVVSPPGGGPPLHVHEREDECFYILDGSFRVQTGEQKFVATVGAFVRFPRGLAHAYQNVGSAPGRLLVIVSPGGYEQFFAAMATVALPPDFAEVTAIAQRFGVSIVGPPLER